MGLGGGSLGDAHPHPENQAAKALARLGGEQGGDIGGDGVIKNAKNNSKGDEGGELEGDEYLTQHAGDNVPYHPIQSNHASMVGF